MPPPLRYWALSDDAHLTSAVCLSVTYIRPKSRTERPRKTKIGTEVAHVTSDSDTTFKVKGQGHQAALIGCSSHYLTYLDANRSYATAQSEPLPVDLHKVTTCTGRGHSVAARLQAAQLVTAAALLMCEQ